jgi:hypothetical protein
MLKTLFELGKTCALLFFLNDYIKRHYPDEYEFIIINASYKFLYFYSQLQFLVKQTTIKTKEYITENYPTLMLVINDFQQFITHNKPIYSQIEFIKNSKIINKVVKNQYLTLDDFENFNYDFIVYNDRSTVPNNIKIISNLPSNNNDLKCLLEDNETYEYETSNIKFILAEIVYKEKSYKLDLSNSKVNFYIKNNVFNYSFFLYYLRYYHEDCDIFNYVDDGSSLEITLKLIDQNVNIFEIELNNDTDYLVIQKDDYIMEISNKTN